MEELIIRILKIVKIIFVYQVTLKIIYGQLLEYKFYKLLFTNHTYYKK